MGLFSTLLGTNEGDEATPPNAASPSSLSLPTVIQMYTDTPFELEIKPGSSIPPYAHLTYQAVPVDPTLDPAAAAALTEPTPAVGLRAAKTATVVRVPTLGVWNCRVQKAQVAGKTQLGDALLAKIPTQRHTVCWKVDLAEPSRVEPTLVALQDALVRYLIQSNDYSEENKQATKKTISEEASSTATTRLSQLRSVQFGVPPASEAAATENGSSTPTVATDERDDAVKVTLQIVAAWPQSATTKKDTSDAEAYRQKQTLALLYYHLRRYAARLNASLVFVRPTVLSSLNVEERDETQESAAEEEVLQPTLNIPQLGAVWRALAQGKTVWEPHVWSEALELARKTPVAATATTTAGNEEDTPSTPDAGADDDATEQEADTTALVYGPGTHSEEWIESVLLRNAQYPGHWDTAKDPIWKILPPPAARETATENHETTQGEEVWLQELRDSVALPAEAPAATTPNKPTSAGDAKTPDVSDYFASLLTK